MIDESFITGIYQDMRPKLCGWLMSRNLDSAKAEDLVQEAFLRIWQRRDTIRDCQQEVIGLLWRLVHNLMIDNYRRMRHETECEEIGMLSDVSGNVIQHQSTADAEFLASRLSDALEAMPRELSEAWRMFQLDDLPIREISTRSGASENLVKVRIHRARCRLKAVLTENEYDN